jgi:hypothetical protein
MTNKSKASHMTLTATIQYLTPSKRPQELTIELASFADPALDRTKSRIRECGQEIVGWSYGYRSSVEVVR